MTPDFKNISPYKERLDLFENSDIVSRIDKAKALYNELVKAPSPTFKALARNFYD